MSVRRTSLILFSLVALVMATPAAAQFGRTAEDGRLELTIQGGYDLPQGDLSQLSDNGYHGGVGVAYRIHPRLFLGAEGQYHGYKMAGDVTGAFGDDLNFSVNVMQFAGTAKFMLNEGPRRMYTKGTAGIFRGEASVSFLGSASSVDSYDPGAALSLGYQMLGVNGSATFLEAGYHRMFSDGANTDWFSFSLGANFYFMRR